MVPPENTVIVPRRCRHCNEPLAKEEPGDCCSRCLRASRGEEAGRGKGPEARPPRVGEAFGHYRLLGRLGEGGMGTVYEAEDLESGRRIALKVLGQALDSAARARFLREGRLAASVNHPNTVYVYGTEEIDAIPVIAMELVAGGTLEDRVRAQGALPRTAAVDMVLQVMAGLEAAHQTGILHRDIKPSNCYLETDGTVKVGDFGLSISTQVRLEPALTVTGAFVGTPAFSSPEQLRGEPLTVHSDIYAVGVTLYYLLTGRKPFAEAHFVQLLAAVLERPAESPARWRRDLPRGLCRVVLRCLEKDPQHRPGSYAELRRALVPYASIAPTPATLGWRFLAGWIDAFLLGTVQVVASAWWVGGWDILVRPDIHQNPGLLYALLTNLVLAALYYGGLEGRWGASLGKGVCGLRVVGDDRQPPGFLRAVARSALFAGVPLIPALVLAGVRPDWSAADQHWKASLASLAHLVLQGSWFVTLRRRNGFAGGHELLTATRVVHRVAALPRMVRPPAREEPARDAAGGRIGPYDLIGPIAAAGQEGLVLAHDARLQRRVWVRNLPAGSPPVPLALRQTGRPGRLRWLGGRRSKTEAWDAYEALEGRPLVEHLARKPGWAELRCWLLDLAAELRALEQDRGAPTVVGLDQMWITAEGRLKVLGFRLPGLGSKLPALNPAEPVPSGRAASPWSPTVSPGAEAGFEAEDAPPPQADGQATRPGSAIRGGELLRWVGLSALEGRVLTIAEARAGQPRGPLALHARSLIQGLHTGSDLDAVMEGLRASLAKPAAITPSRRLGLLGLCLGFPIATALAVALVVAGVQRALSKHPDGIVLNLCLGRMQEIRSGPQPGLINGADLERAFATYVIGRFGAVITNAQTWNSPPWTISVTRPQRTMAERLVAEHATPTPEEWATAAALVHAQFKSTPDDAADGAIRQVQPIQVGLLVGYGGGLVGVIVPSLLAAVTCRGGLALSLVGVLVVTGDGSRAGRGRVLWRQVLAASPFLLLLGSIAGARTWMGWTPAALAGGILFGGLALASALLPERSLQDRLAGTWLVPR